MSDKIYMITSGCYSDYSVDSYVDTEEEAIRVCYALNNKKGKYSAEYEYEKLEKFTGEVKKIDLYKGFRFELTVDNNLSCYSLIKTEPFNNKIGFIYENSYYGIINNPDEEKAKKIFYDKLSEFKANEEGI